MSLAIFDLDNTLLADDSDYLWGRFLVEQGVVDAEHYESENQRFYDDYKAGRLDIYEFLRFSLQPLAEHSSETLAMWHQRFMAEKIEPIVLPGAERLLEHHRQQGDQLLIITATNRFVTGPIAQRLGVTEILATEAEFQNGRYTGAVSGTPCFQHGKVERLEQWLSEHHHSMSGSWFYSDSYNDLPLLQCVEHPVAVDPDQRLREHASTVGWSIITLREG